KGSNVGGARNIRAAAARNQREKELRERESQKEKVRADAACRRKGRAERRRGDDSDPSDEPPLPWANSTKGGTKAPAQTLEPPISSHNTPDTPPTGNSAPTSTSHRKTGRPPARRGRVGRNQYSKDREPPLDANGEHSLSLNRSQSYDRGYGDEKANGINGTSTSEPGKLSKTRYVNPTRTSMNEMKRRVAAILEFISKTQIEMAGDPDPPVGDTSATSTIRGLAEGLGTMLTQSSNGEAVEKGIAEVRQKEFGQLSSLEMMDVLTRELVLWQKKFGKHGEK
ncbi:MAG: hypothetical protein M1835_003010, partial [Candelina submexicana]